MKSKHFPRLGLTVLSTQLQGRRHHSHAQIRTTRTRIFQFATLLFIAFTAAGCASRRIETSMTTLSPRPQSFPGARVASGVPAKAQTGVGYNPGAVVAASMAGTIVTPSIVVVSGDTHQAALTYNLFAERRLYDAIRQFSEGAISSASRSEYEIERIEVVGQYADQKVGETVALRSASFFLPPLASVKTHTECPYQVGYVLKRGDQTIRQHFLSGIIKGNFKGWYVAGAVQGRRLVEELNAAAEREVAVRLLSDIYDAIESEQKHSGR